MNIATIITAANWLGTAEQCEAVRQFARDYDWSDTSGAIEVDVAADAILSELRGDDEIDPEAEAKLRAEIVASAERENARRWREDTEEAMREDAPRGTCACGGAPPCDGPDCDF